MPNTKPKKSELAKFKALHDIGLTPHAIGKRTGRDPKTIRKYLASEIYNDAEMQDLIEEIKQNELDDLFLLGAKARKRLHELLDEGDTKAIETTAIMDRTFQQRRLLEGQSTENISVHTIVERCQRKLDDLDRERKYLERRLQEAE